MSVSSLGSSPSPLGTYLDSIASISGTTSTSLGSSEIALSLSTTSFPQDTFQSSHAASSTPGTDAASPLQARAAWDASDILSTLGSGSSGESDSVDAAGSADSFAQKLQSLIAELQRDLAAENSSSSSASSIGTTTSSVSSAAVDSFLGNLQAFGTQLLASAQASAAAANAGDDGSNSQSSGGSSNTDALGAIQGGHHGHGGGHMGGAGRLGGGSLLDSTDDTSSVTSSISLALSSISGALDLYTSSLSAATATTTSAFGNDPFLQTLQTLGQGLASSIQKNLADYQQQDRIWQTYSEKGGAGGGAGGTET